MKKGVSKYPELAGLHGHDYIRAHGRLVTAMLHRKGLTSRETTPVRAQMDRLPDLRRGLPRNVYDALRARRWRAKHTVSLAKFMDEIATLVARAYEFLPPELRQNATALAVRMAKVAKHNRKRKVRIA